MFNNTISLPNSLSGKALVKAVCACRPPTGSIKVIDLRHGSKPSALRELGQGKAARGTIDSWLEVTARRMDLPLGVARALDLPTATRPTWIRWLSLDQLDVIQAATGCHRVSLKL